MLCCRKKLRQKELEAEGRLQAPPGAPSTAQRRGPGGSPGSAQQQQAAQRQQWCAASLLSQPAKNRTKVEQRSPMLSELALALTGLSRQFMVLVVPGPYW